MNCDAFAHHSESKREKAAALAVVIGRAGSKGLPGKNARSLAGRPMVCYAIDDAIAAQSVDRVVCSTDGEAIARAASAMGVEVVDRPAHLAGDDASVDSAVRHAVESRNATHEVIVILYANVPIRPSDLIDRAVSMLIQTGADSVQSYCDVGKYHPHWMVQLDDDQRVKPYQPSTAYRRQDLPALCIPDGGVIAVRRHALFTTQADDPHAFLGRDRRGLQLPPGAVVDVDTQEDFLFAQSIVSRNRAQYEARA